RLRMIAAPAWSAEPVRRGQSSFRTQYPWSEDPSWRRRRDSNPRYGKSPYGGLANRWFQPLTHVSGSGTLCRRSGLYKALGRRSTAATIRRRARIKSGMTARESLRDHVQPGVEAHRFAGGEDAQAEGGPFAFGVVERAIGMGDGLGDEDPALRGRIELEEFGLRR